MTNVNIDFSHNTILCVELSTAHITATDDNLLEEDSFDDRCMLIIYKKWAGYFVLLQYPHPVHEILDYMKRRGYSHGFLDIMSSLLTGFRDNVQDVKTRPVWLVLDADAPKLPTYPAYDW